MSRLSFIPAIASAALCLHALPPFAFDNRMHVFRAPPLLPTYDISSFRRHSSKRRRSRVEVRGW